MGSIEDTKPFGLLTARVWTGTEYHFPHIEKMAAELRQLRREVERLRAVAEAAKDAVGPCLRCGLVPIAERITAALKALEAPHEG